ncbi:MAG TPA: hypothetical protein VJ814_02615 [Gaiellaceae bacterium]|nr:hypothetical protein [Gaiellaceae bacterium]
MRRGAAAAGLLAGAALLASGCGSSHRGAAGHTTVRYGIYPGDTASVSTADPRSASCNRDAVAFARGSAQFLTHYSALAASPADPYYMLLRQQLADFQARRCDPQLLGRALEDRLSPKERRVLLGHASRPMADALRQALSAADE